MTVKAWLEGRPGDLEEIARQFDTGDPSIGRDDDGNYYLTSPSLEDLWGSGRLHEVAASMLVQVNGLARVFNPTYRPVRLTARISDDSGRGHMVAIGAAIEVNAALALTVVSVGGTTQEPPPPRAPDFMKRAAEHPDVAEALTILGANVDHLNWRDHLYRVFEIIRHNVGGQDALIAKGWKSREDISAFTVSANSPRVSGEAARHARLNDGIPKRTMSLDEGRSFITQLVLAWMTDLSNTE